jgi:hypothetical protein
LAKLGYVETKTVSQKFWHRPNLREWWVGEKLIGKAIANALPCLNDDVKEAKEITMVEGWSGEGLRI